MVHGHPDHIARCGVLVLLLMVGLATACVALADGSGEQGVEYTGDGEPGDYDFEEDTGASSEPGGLAGDAVPDAGGDERPGDGPGYNERRAEEAAADDGGERAAEDERDERAAADLGDQTTAVYLASDDDADDDGDGSSSLSEDAAAALDDRPFPSHAIDARIVDAAGAGRLVVIDFGNRLAAAGIAANPIAAGESGGFEQYERFGFAGIADAGRSSFGWIEDESVADVAGESATAGFGNDAAGRLAGYNSRYFSDAGVHSFEDTRESVRAIPARSAEPEGKSTGQATYDAGKGIAGILWTPASVLSGSPNQSHRSKYNFGNGEVDRNKDGVQDAVDLDPGIGGDGDQEQFDTNGDGEIDAYDTTGNGKPDKFFADDGDSRADYFDTDGDGVADAVDTDGDGHWDLRDSDGDGYADQKNTDGDDQPEQELAGNGQGYEPINEGDDRKTADSDRGGDGNESSDTGDDDTSSNQSEEDTSSEKGTTADSNDDGEADTSIAESDKEKDDQQSKANDDSEGGTTLPARGPNSPTQPGDIKRTEKLIGRDLENPGEDAADPVGKRIVVSPRADAATRLRPEQLDRIKSDGAIGPLPSELADAAFVPKSIIRVLRNPGAMGPGAGAGAAGGG